MTITYRRWEYDERKWVVWYYVFSCSIEHYLTFEVGFSIKRNCLCASVYARLDVFTPPFSIGRMNSDVPNMFVYEILRSLRQLIYLFCWLILLFVVIFEELDGNPKQTEKGGPKTGSLPLPWMNFFAIRGILVLTVGTKCIAVLISSFWL